MTWLIEDRHGTQSAAIDAATQQVTKRYQDPFGVPRGNGSTWVNSRGFVGGTVDTTGLTHLGAREYDPATGRFLSVGPILDFGNPQQPSNSARSPASRSCST